MSTIEAYTFDPSYDTALLMPAAAKVRSAQVNYGPSSLWAEVDKTAAALAFPLLVIDTGDEVPTNAQYLGIITFGPIVKHVYLGQPG